MANRQAAPLCVVVYCVERLDRTILGNWSSVVPLDTPHHADAAPRWPSLFCHTRRLVCFTMKTLLKSLTAFVFAMGHTSVAHAATQLSWEDAIEAVEEKMFAYYNYAIELDPMSQPGTALHGIGHDRHICAITGRMLGFREEIAEAETLEDPPLVPDANAMELMMHSMTLDAWVAAARRATAMSHNQKVGLWNLECVGKHGIPRTAFIEDSSVVGDFSLLGETLVVYGNIDAGFYDRFLGALEDNPTITEVALGSAGGSVQDAIQSGIEIRRRGLSTTLHGPCYSACPLVFIGGEPRTVWAGPGPHLGFHQVYTSSGALPLNHQVYTVIARYLQAMGADPGAVIGWMAVAGPTEIFEPELEALCPAGVATWVQRTCG